MTNPHAFPTANLRLKRAYEPAEPSDGTRILGDRLWPRGVSKDRADLSDWMKEIAPTTELRKWFGHDPAKWPEFQRRYRAELAQQAADLDRIRALAARGVVTLIYSAHDETHNDAVVLHQVLLQTNDGGDGGRAFQHRRSCHLELRGGLGVRHGHRHSHPGLRPQGLYAPCSC